MDGMAKKKRVREDDQKHHHLATKSTKTQNDLNQDRSNNRINLEYGNNSSDSSGSWDSYMGLEVFDFPWLHDESMISTSLDDWSSQDSFFPLLDNASCETTTPVYEKFDKNKLFSPLRDNGGVELEAVECIWSSLFTPQRQQDV